MYGICFCRFHKLQPFLYCGNHSLIMRMVCCSQLIAFDVALWFLLSLLSIVDLLSAFVHHSLWSLKSVSFQKLRKLTKQCCIMESIQFSLSHVFTKHTSQKTEQSDFILHMPHLFTTSRVSASYGLSFWDGLYYLELQVQPSFWDILQLLMHLWSLSKGISSSTGNLNEYGFIMPTVAVQNIFF